MQESSLYFRKSAFISSLIGLAITPLTAQPIQVQNTQLLLTPENTPFVRAMWSPSGEQLLFTGTNYNGLFTYSTKTKAFEVLNNDPAIGFGATWVDESTILVRHTIKENMLSKHAVALVSTNGDVATKTDYIHSMPSVPVLSSDFSSVYYLDKTTLKTVSSGIPAKSTQNSTPDLIPVGNRFVQTVKKSTGIEQKSVLQFDGDIINLTRSKDGNRLAFEIVGGDLHVYDIPSASLYNLGRLNRPSFSPDGNFVVAMATQDDGYDFTSSELVALRFDGSYQVELTSNVSIRAMNPAWSPDGKQIVFDSPDTGALYLISITY